MGFWQGFITGVAIHVLLFMAWVGYIIKGEEANGVDLEDE